MDYTISFECRRAPHNDTVREREREPHWKGDEAVHTIRDERRHRHYMYALRTNGVNEPTP